MHNATHRYPTHITGGSNTTRASFLSVSLSPTATRLSPAVRPRSLADFVHKTCWLQPQRQHPTVPATRLSCQPRRKGAHHELVLRSGSATAAPERPRWRCRPYAGPMQQDPAATTSKSTSRPATTQIQASGMGLLGGGGASRITANPTVTL